MPQHSKVDTKARFRRGLKSATEATKRHMRAWHADPVETVLEYLKTDQQGLSRDEAARRLAEYGNNAFTEIPPPSLLARVVKQLKSPLTVVLLLACIVTVVLGKYLDSSVIFVALAIAVGVGVLQEGRASRAFSVLSRSQEKHATVIRGGKKHVIDAGELVPGDVVEIHDGMYIPADLRLLESRELAVNESALTGEWLMVGKRADAVPVGAPFAERYSMVWMGTFVPRGHGLGVVVATGDETEAGKLAASVQGPDQVVTPLQKQMARISHFMLAVVSCAVVLIFALGIMRGEPLQEMFLTAVAIAVASVPEGLPAAVTIVLAVGMESLLKRGGLVRNLLAAETLGSTSVILTDKTGTLTEAKMAVTAIVHAPGDEKGAVGDTLHDRVSIEILNIALCASNAFFDEKDGTSPDTLHAVGEPLERALLLAAHEAGVTESGEGYRAHRIDYLSFTSERRYALGLASVGKTSRLCINGAPETLLAASSRVHTEHGPRQMTKKMREFFAETLETHTKRGERIIGVAYKNMTVTEIEPDGNDHIENAVFAGFVIFHDPIRSDIKEAIAEVQRAGVRVVLVTGDNQDTAHTIATTVGIAKPNEKVLLGSDIEAMDDAALLSAFKNTSVFARVLPNEKMRIAAVLQARGDTVAMTGDGVNDAPALKRADIGISIGSGTEVAKEASDLVLINDSFKIIVAAIEEGRRIIGNLRKIVGYLLSTSFSEVALIGTALLMGMPVPLTPAQILWGNIIEEGLMSVAFAFEPGDKHSMDRQGKPVRHVAILSRAMLAFVSMVVVITGGLLIALYFFIQSLDLRFEEVRSIMFLAITIDSLFIAFSFRALSTPLWKIDLRSNRFFLMSFAVSSGLLIIALTVPFMQYVLSYEPLSAVNLMLVVGFGLLTLLTVEVGKWLFFERRAR